MKTFYQIQRNATHFERERERRRATVDRRRQRQRRHCGCRRHRRRRRCIGVVGGGASQQLLYRCFVELVCLWFVCFRCFFGIAGLDNFFARCVAFIVVVGGDMRRALVVRLTLL